MADFPALPLWTDAYLADTGDLNACEHGCYLILLMIAWRRPDCALPNDMKWMKRSLNAYCGGSMHGNSFNSIVPRLLERFFQLGADGKFHQKRLRKEREFVVNFCQSQKEKVVNRWARHRENKDLADTTVLPRYYHPHPHPRRKEEAPAAPGAFSSPNTKNGSADARTLLFQNGVDDVAALTGRPATKVRALVGRWLKLADDDALRILTLIAKAKQDRPAEPVAWIEGHLRPRPSQPSGPPRGAMLGNRR